MVKLIVVLMIFILPGTITAQLDPGPDGIGIYFDTAAQENCLHGASGYIRGFLIITHPSIETGISFWTCHVDYELPAGTTISGWVLTGNVINIYEPPNFFVARYSSTAPLIPCTDATRVAWFDMYMAVPGCAWFRVRESDGQYGFPSQLAYHSGHDPDVDVPLNPAAGDQPNAGINCSDCDSAVSAETQTWGMLKALYR